MSAVQAENVCASFLFVGDLNGHHREWLGCTNTNRQGVAALTNKLVVGTTHARGDLRMTDVLDQAWVAVIASIGTGHSYLSAVTSMAQAVPNLCACRKVFLKHQLIGIQFVQQYWISPCETFGLLTIPFPEQASALLVGRYWPTNVIRVHNKNKLWFNYQCRIAFDLKHEAHVWWTRDHSRINWEEFVLC